MAAEQKPWKLMAKPFDRFTGILNNVYPVKDGVVMYPDNDKPNVLIDHYGAVPLAQFEAEQKTAAVAKAAEGAKK